MRLPEGTDRCVASGTIGGLYVSINASPTGRFEIAGLVEGTWKLRARTYGGEHRCEGFAEVKAGADVVEIEVAPRER